MGRIVKSKRFRKFAALHTRESLRERKSRPLCDLGKGELEGIVAPLRSKSCHILPQFEDFIQDVVSHVPLTSLHAPQELEPRPEPHVLRITELAFPWLCHYKYGIGWCQKLVQDSDDSHLSSNLSWLCCSQSRFRTAVLKMSTGFRMIVPSSLAPNFPKRQIVRISSLIPRT
jgi:hypothetical protein